MKNLIKIMMILSVFSQVSRAQFIVLDKKQESEYKGPRYLIITEAQQKERNEKSDAWYKQLSSFNSVEEYQSWYDGIVSKLIKAEKGKDEFLDKSFSDFVKFLNGNGINIVQYGLIYDHDKVFPKDVHGLRLYFQNLKQLGFASDNWLRRPTLVINFKGKKQPYEDAFLLTAKYFGVFNDEILKMFSDSQMESIEFDYRFDSIYMPKPIYDN